jgi:DNA-binding Lrp family transcriptional regulator
LFSRIYAVTLPQHFEIDAIDRAILKTLQQQARIQNTHLADRVGISAPTCWKRVRKLENAGVIERYVAQVDTTKVGMGLTLFVRVWLSNHDQETTVSTFCGGNCDVPASDGMSPHGGRQRFLPESRRSGPREVQTFPNGAIGWH